jgi:hypothetical protein
MEKKFWVRWPSSKSSSDPLSCPLKPSIAGDAGKDDGSGGGRGGSDTLAVDLAVEGWDAAADER